MHYVFYQCYNPLERVLSKLLEKVISSGNRSLILGYPEAVESLDNVLWTYSTSSFLPHGTYKDGHPEWQPIWLESYSDSVKNINYATVLIVMNTSKFITPQGFDKCLDVYHESEITVSQVYERYVLCKKLEYLVECWQETKEGKWIKQPELHPQ